MRSSIVYIYNSFKDPLFQATLWLYLKEETKIKRFEFHLITYEQKEFEVSSNERDIIRDDLKSLNIHWYPLKWHSGRFKLFKKAYDLILAFLLIAKIKLRFKVTSIISLGTVAGSFAFLLSRVFRLKSYIYQYERHSEFLADFGIWSRKSMSFFLLNYFERISGKKSELIATGTNHMISRLQSEQIEGEIYLLPSCVDDDTFQFSSSKRQIIRKKLKIEDRKALIYLGKFGGIYYSLAELAKFFSALIKLDPSYFILILTPESEDEVSEHLLYQGVPKSSFYISRVTHNEVPGYLSAADIGLVAVPGYPSQKFRSPIKVGEYLCCGLPYIVGEGISEDDIIAERENVGVVIKSYDSEGLENALPKIEKLLSENRDVIKERCRSAGLSYRGFHHLKHTGKKIFDNLAGCHV